MPRGQEITVITIIIAGFVFLVGAFILQGLRRIPAKPPHKGALTRFGKRTRAFLDEGWRFLPIYPYWYGFIPVKVERITFTITVEGARTPDRAESKIPVLLTLRPLPELLTEYIDSGEEEGVKAQITGKVQERVREWAMGAEEGPADWVELNRSQLEAVSVLVKKIARNSLTPIPLYGQNVPTWIWLRYYARPRPRKLLENEKPWAEPLAPEGDPEAEHGWRRIEDTLNRIRDQDGPELVRKFRETLENHPARKSILETVERIERESEPEEVAVDVLKAMVARRKEEIDTLRTGSGNIILEDLGCRLERLNLGDIDVLGGVREKAEAQARENEERQAEELELRFVRARIKELTTQPPDGPGFSAEQALEVVQTERGKVTKTVAESKLNISPETRTMIERVVPDVVSAITGRR